MSGYCGREGCPGYGQPLTPEGLCVTVKTTITPTILTDSEAVEMIAASLRGPKWDDDTFEEIATAVRYTGRNTYTGRPS